jgi:ABC-type phosphate/phosphonate transport system permease subunit
MISERAEKRWRIPFSGMFGSRKVFAAYIVCWSITLATMVASIVSSLASRVNSNEKMIEHVALCVVAVVFMHIPVRMYTKMDFHIPPFIQIIIAFFIVAHFVLGEVFRFYDDVSFFDKVLHVTAGGVMAMCGFSIAYGYSKSEDGAVRLSPFFFAMFSFCFAITLMTLWEIFEYAVDRALGYNMQRWKDGLSEITADGVTYMVTNCKQGTGLKDTMADIIVGTVSAAVVSVVGGLWFAKNQGFSKYLVIRKKNGRRG